MGKGGKGKRRRRIVDGEESKKKSEGQRLTRGDILKSTPCPIFLIEPYHTFGRRKTSFHEQKILLLI